jgi:hypothetical protein
MKSNGFQSEVGTKARPLGRSDCERKRNRVGKATPPPDTRHKQSDKHRPHTNEDLLASPLNALTEPLRVTSAAINEVPAVRFALGLAGIAATASIVATFVGSGAAAIVTMSTSLGRLDSSDTTRHDGRHLRPTRQRELSCR